MENVIRKIWIKPEETLFSSPKIRKIINSNICYRTKDGCVMAIIPIWINNLIHINFLKNPLKQIIIIRKKDLSTWKM